MDKANDRAVCELVVTFEEPFWVAVYQRREAGCLWAARVVFGAQPRDQEVLEYFMRQFGRLRFGRIDEGAPAPTGPKNPKRARREAAKATRLLGVGTRAQQALQQQREASAAKRKQQARDNAQEQAQRKFALKQQKKKQKHRGR